MHLRCVDSSFQICDMTGSTHLSTWVDAHTKLRFGNAAARQGLSESALLKRLVGQMLASVPEATLAPIASADLRDARVTVRLVPEDRTLLRENLKLTVDERFRKFESFARYARELQEAGRRHRSQP